MDAHRRVLTASAEDVAALEWLDLELRTADARRPRVVDELARAESVATAAGVEPASPAFWQGPAPT